MKMKRVPTVLLCIIMAAAMAASCSKASDSSESAQSGESETITAKGEDMRELYVRTPKSCEDMTAVFLNTSSGEAEQVEMTVSQEDDNYHIFCCEADANLYNMVHVTYGNKESMDVAFNGFVSGWYLTDDELLPYAADSESNYDPQFETKVFQFDGYDKNVYIWTPDDYDEKSDEKYSVIYLFDGQSVLATGTERGMDNDYVCWNVCESVLSMMDVTENQAIIVAIDNNDVYRWDELIPDLGEINMEGESSEIKAEDLTRKRGSAFADLLCDTIMPYVQENYNVYTDARHTALAGSSLGGLETFYTVLAHPEKFGTGGVMSATFDMYAEKEWADFLSDKIDMENAPFLYFYAGGYMTDNGDVTEMMNNKLIENGYPGDKIVFNKYEPGEHLIEYWRNIFPEFLQAFFDQDVPALPFGVPVHYEDTSDPIEEYLEEMELDVNEIEPGYVYYDNSETKWEHVHAYWWGGMSFNSVTKEAYYFAEWPGFEMEQMEGTDIYRIIAPWGITGGIIFDSGVSDREVAQGKAAYQTVDLTYSTDMMGKIYQIDLSVKPTTDPGNMKTKHRYPAGNWSDYSPYK